MSTFPVAYTADQTAAAEVQPFPFLHLRLIGHTPPYFLYEVKAGNGDLQHNQSFQLKQGFRLRSALL